MEPEGESLTEDCAGMAKTAIILGGHSNHILLARKLKDRGYFTILVDYLDSPPVSKIVDEHVQISTFDTEAVKHLAEERHADLIINCCLEHLNKGIAQIAEELGLPMLYSYETALNVSDKRRMKRIMRDNGIPTTDFVVVNSLEQVQGLNLRYPLFVKPADGSGSTGVNRAASQEELFRFVQIALGFSKCGSVIIEEEAPGKECNVYCVIRDGKADILTLSEKFSEVGGTAKVTKAIASLWPAEVSEKALQSMRSAAQGIADAFKLRTTPMFMQLKVDGDRINLIEFACRMAGGYSYKNMLSKLRFDYFDFTIDAFEQKLPEVSIQDDGKRCVIHSLYAKPCVFDRLEGLDELLESGVVSDFSIVRPSGTEVSEISANKEKIGFFIVRDDTVEGLLDRVKTVYDHIEAYDVLGNKVLRRDIYLNKSLLR